MDSEQRAQQQKGDQRTPEDWKRIASRWQIVWLIILALPLLLSCLLIRHLSPLSPTILKGLLYLDFLLLLIATGGVVIAELKSSPRKSANGQREKHQPKTAADWQRIASRLHAVWVIAVVFLIGLIFLAGPLGPGLRRSLGPLIFSVFMATTLAWAVARIVASVRSSRKIPQAEWPLHARRSFLKVGFIGLLFCPIAVGLILFPFSEPRIRIIRTLGWVLLANDLFLISFSFPMAYVAHRKAKARGAGSNGQN